MYIFGGFIDGIKTNEVLKYNFNSNTWESVTPVPTSPKPQPRSSHSAVIIENKMIIFAGKDDANEKLNDTWGFDLVSLIWEHYKCED